MVAEALASRINATDVLRAGILPEGDIPDVAGLAGLVVCTSSHGEGELPDCLVPLYDRWSLDRPDLSGLFFGIVALGDQTYHRTFCWAGRKMEALLKSLGCHHVEPTLEVDAATQVFADDVAVGWLEDWLDRVRSEHLTERGRQ